MRKRIPSSRYCGVCALNKRLRGRSGRFRRPGVDFHLIDGGFVVGGVDTDAK